MDNAYHVPYAHKALGSNLDLGSYKATIHDGFSIQVNTNFVCQCHVRTPPQPIHNK